MSLSPSHLRLVAGLAIFAAFGGAIFWVSRVPLQPRRVRSAPSSVGMRSSTFGGNAWVEGRVVGADGKPARADVSVIGEGAQPMRGGAIRARRSASTRTSDDGRFSLNVNAGHVVVVAHAASDESAEAASLWAAAEANPSAGAHVGTTLTLQRTGGLSGTIELVGRPGASSRNLAGTMVSLEPANADAKASLLDGAPHVTAGADGRFVLPDVPAGQYRLTAAIAPPWIVDRVMASGRDSLDAPVTILPGAFVTDAVVAATDMPNEVDGHAVDAAGHGVPFGLVFAFAAEPADRGPARRLQATRTDRDGHFTLTGLPSGSYLMGLATGSDTAAWYSPAFLADLARRATPVRVVAGTTHATVGGARPQGEWP